MKKTLCLSILLIIFASSAWALTITTSSGTYEAGDVDTLYSSTSMVFFNGSWGGYSGFDAEVAWVKSILGDGITMVESDKTNVTSANWGYGYSGTDLVWGFNFVEGFDYFVIKTGNKALGGNNHFLYTNLDSLYWGVINLATLGVDVENISKVSHIEGINPGTPPVPEPTTLLLLGSGLLGLAGFRKKMKK